MVASMPVAGDGSPDDWGLLGWKHVRTRDYDAAVDCLLAATSLRHGSAWWSVAGYPGPPQASEALVNVLKLEHDIEQMSYLLDRHLLPLAFVEVRAQYEALCREMITTYGRLPIIRLRRGLVPAFDDTYQRMLRWRETPRISGSTLGAGWDAGEVAARYAVPPGICWIDGLLSPTALNELTAFALESTIWSDIAHNYVDGEVSRGYLGAYSGNGFCAPLLFQVAEELSRALPDVFGGRPLRQMWAYKYEASLEGIAIHGDDAGINVNFWITPDEANLAPETGGLVVYPVEAPPDWNFVDINQDQARIRSFLTGSGVVPLNIPYRQNRAVIFNSDLFHATAPLRFRPGYENRRINVTMLFGQRGG
jgi:hypothetical protein